MTIRASLVLKPMECLYVCVQQITCEHFLFYLFFFLMACAQQKGECDLFHMKCRGKNGKIKGRNAITVMCVHWTSLTLIVKIAFIFEIHSINCSIAWLLTISAYFVRLLHFISHTSSLFLSLFLQGIIFNAFQLFYCLGFLSSFNIKIIYQKPSWFKCGHDSKITFHFCRFNRSIQWFQNILKNYNIYIKSIFHRWFIQTLDKSELNVIHSRWTLPKSVLQAMED